MPRAPGWHRPVLRFEFTEMAHTMKQLNLILPGELVEQVEAALSQFNMSQAEFFVEATKNELIRLDESKIREDIALMEIDKKILSEGQSVNIVVEAGDPVPDAPYSQCELCNELLSSPEAGFAGPLFCERCMEIAKGAKFDGLSP